MRCLEFRIIIRDLFRSNQHTIALFNTLKATKASPTAVATVAVCDSRDNWRTTRNIEKSIQPTVFYTDFQVGIGLALLHSNPLEEALCHIHFYHQK